MNCFDHERANPPRTEFALENVQMRTVQKYLLLRIKGLPHNVFVMEKLDLLFVNFGALIRFTSHFVKLIHLQHLLLTCFSQIKIKSFNGSISLVLYFHRQVTCFAINQPIGRHTKNGFKSSAVSPKSIG